MSNQNQNMPYMMNQMYPNNYNMGTMPGMYGAMNQMGGLEPPKKERLRVKLTTEESGLFQIADKDGKGKLVGKEAADFLKKSGLSKENLKLIWLISAQTDPQFLERDEFYIALRLIALAQNNMEVSEDSIRLNHPLPPMPKFDLKSSSQSTTASSMGMGNLTNMSELDSQPTNRSSISNISIQEIDNYSLSEEDIKKYTLLFNKNKDMEFKMSINKAFQMWSTAGVSNDTMKKILTIVPLSDKTCLSFSEFKVIFHLIYKSQQSDVPVNLPNSLKKVLSESVNNLTGQNNNNSNIDFGDKMGLSLNMNPSGNSANISSNVVTQMPINSNMSIPSTNKSVDMEALLMSEFSLKQSSQNEPTKTVIPIIHTINDMNPNLNTNPNSLNNQVFQPNFMQQPQPNGPAWNTSVNANSNFSPMIPEIKKMNENLNIVLRDTTSENQFLNKVLDEDNSTLSSLLEEIERITKTINLINEKNRMIRDQITDVRRKINSEQDNLSKINSTLNSKVNELMSNQDELLKANENFNALRLGNNHTQTSMNNLSTSNNMNPVNNTNRHISFSNSNTANIIPQVEIQQNKNSVSNVNLPVVNNEDGWGFNNNNQNPVNNMNNQFIATFNSSNLGSKPAFDNSKILEYKDNNKSFDAALGNNKNTGFDFDSKFESKLETFNKFDKFEKYDTFDNGFADFEKSGLVNKPGTHQLNEKNNQNVSYPQFSNNISNPPLNQIQNQPIQNSNQPSASSNNRINTDFDFDSGFDGMGNFKEFADKKGDDMFKKAEFDTDWDKF